MREPIAMNDQTKANESEELLAHAAANWDATAVCMAELRMRGFGYVVSVSNKRSFQQGAGYLFSDQLNHNQR